MENKQIVIPPLHLKRHKSFFTTNETLYKNVNATAKTLEKRPEVITALRNFYTSVGAPNSEKITKRLQLHLDWLGTNPEQRQNTLNMPQRPSPNLSHPPASPPRIIRKSSSRIIKIDPVADAGAVAGAGAGAGASIPKNRTKSRVSRATRRRETRKQTNK